MTDMVSGGADAPAAAAPTPIPTEAPSQTQPLGTQTPVAEKPPAPPEVKPEPKKEPAPPSKSAGEAIRKANEAAKAKTEDEPKPKVSEVPAKPSDRPQEPARQEQPRGDGGKFASPNPQPPTAEPKDPAPQPVADSPHREAPARFSNDAKAAWESAPEPIRAETHRAIRELEQGYTKHKADAEAYASLKPFDDLARQNGGNLRASLEKINEIENTFARDPIAGFQKVAEHFGIPLRAVAAHIMGQSPDQVQQQQDSTIAELRQQVAALTQQIGGVTQTFQKQQETATLSQIEVFASKPEHSRFEELSEDIAFFLQAGRAATLSEAYQLAERLNPATPAASKPEPAAPATPSAPPLNPAGLKSISGAPSSGSDPVSIRTPASSNREALRKAFARAG